MVNSATSAFNRQVLSQLGAPPSGQGLEVLNIMAQGESGGYLTTVNNPEATTKNGPGAYNLPGSVFASGRNTAGVKGYGTTAQGVAATASTLKQSNFAALFGLLKRGAPLSAYTTGAPAAELRAWQGGSSEDVNNIRAAAKGGKVTTTGQTSGGSSAQGGGGSSAQQPNPVGPLAPSSLAGDLGSLLGTVAGAAAGATAAGVVTGGSAAAGATIQTFYQTAKPYVVPIAVSFFLAILITPVLTGKRGNPVAVTLNELGSALPSSAGGESGDTPPGDSGEAAAAPASPPPPPPEQPMTPAQVIQDQVGKGARSNQAIYREIERRRRAGTLIEDAGAAAAA